MLQAYSAAVLIAQLEFNVFKSLTHTRIHMPTHKPTIFQLFFGPICLIARLLIKHGAFPSVYLHIVLHT